MSLFTTKRHMWFGFLPFDLRDLMILWIEIEKPTGFQKSTIKQTVWTKCKTQSQGLWILITMITSINIQVVFFPMCFFQIYAISSTCSWGLEWFGHDWFDVVPDHFKKDVDWLWLKKKVSGPSGVGYAPGNAERFDNLIHLQDFEMWWNMPSLPSFMPSYRYGSLVHTCSKHKYISPRTSNHKSSQNDKKLACCGN